MDFQFESNSICIENGEEASRENSNEKKEEASREDSDGISFEVN